MGDTAPMPNLKVAERGEEDKFKQKFPGRKPASTDFLRKRLQKGVKYFDSGDYAMAKSGKKSAGAPVIGKAHPTPEVVTQRKISNASKSKLVEGALIQATDDQSSDDQEAKQCKEDS